jgi:hypothetical protein
MRTFLGRLIQHGGRAKARLSVSLLLVALSGTIFWFAVVPRARADTCIVCHKLTTTLYLTCDSLDYLRHKDHGDPDGPCPSSQ